MGRKRTAEEYFQTAKANDWVAGTYKEEDRVLPNPSRETSFSSYLRFVKLVL